MKRLLILLFFSFSFSGCIGTLMSGVGGPGTIKGPYGGVKTDIECLKETYTPDANGKKHYVSGTFFGALMIIDIPFSCIFDTLVLPSTIGTDPNGKSKNEY
jgi:uncharacterized protein YceK